VRHEYDHRIRVFIWTGLILFTPAYGKMSAPEKKPPEPDFLPIAWTPAPANIRRINRLPGEF
jgi:hypothetical protein